MFIAVYRWTVKKDMEERFVAAWTAGTKSISKIYGSWGARMHRDEKGGFVSYAQWPDRAAWEKARDNRFRHDEKQAAKDFYESIENSDTVMLMDVIDDLLELRRP